MKKFMIFAASAALVLSAACTKTEVTRSLNDEVIPIGFTNYAGRNFTKASSSYFVDNSSAAYFAAGTKIKVYGYSTNTAVFSGAVGQTPAFMPGTVVTFNSTSDNATQAYTPVRYWPKDESNLLSFYGVYPGEIDGTLTDATVTSTVSAGLGTHTFTQDSIVTKMVDFMASDVAYDLTYSTCPTPGVVPLNFHHLLAKVNFRFQLDGDLDASVSARITEVKILKDGIKTTSIYTPSYSASATPRTTFGDAVQSALYTKDMIVPIHSGGNAYILLPRSNANPATIDNSDVAEEKNFLFVPQSVTDAFKVKIKYILNQGNVETENVQTVNLNSATNVTAWGQNDNIIYTFKIGLNPIQFTATVAAWDGLTVASTIDVN